MVHWKTIDSYKVKYTNPILILEELLSVINGFESGQIKRFETVNLVRNEAQKRLREDSGVLDYAGFDKDFVRKNIESLNQNTREEAKTTLKILIEKNRPRYRADLLSFIENTIMEKREEKGAFLAATEQLEKPINFLFAGLIRSGFSKKFLLKFIYSLFVKGPEITFSERFAEFRRICLRGKKSFDVIIKCKLPGDLARSGADLFAYFDRISQYRYEQLVGSSNSIVRDFFKEGQRVTYFRKKVDAYDRYSAIFQAKPYLGKFLDLIHLGYDQKGPIVEQQVLVFNIDDPNGRAEPVTMSFPLEGFYRSGINFFETLVKKVAAIDNNSWISDETKKKIRSAIRYLRLGSQAIEEEHRYLNYWIGLEYLFSDFSGGSTFERIKRFLIPIHTNVYISRNLFAFHVDLIEMGCHHKSDFINKDDLGYQFVQGNWTILEDKYWQDFPLLAARASHLRTILFSESERKSYINKQTKTLEQHLSRLYRVRNEIVHDAAIDGNFAILISSLRYYLVFILSTLIESLASSSPEEGVHSIDDFFVRNAMKFEFLKEKKIDLGIIMASNEHFDAVDIYSKTYMQTPTRA